MRLIYSFFISIAWQFLKLLSLTNKKIKQFTSGRNLDLDKPELSNPIWIHCASVGEFEQARPLIELIKKNHGQQQILLTFFSPSGFNHLHDYELADHICYAPFDTPKQVKAFLSAFNPRTLILIKYEFWKNMLHYTSAAGISVYSVSSIFRSSQHFFKWYGGFFRKDLKKISHFFVQNESSLNLLASIQLTNATVTGDTRFDRVIDIAEKSMEVESIKNYCNAEHVIIAGSTWPQDEEALLTAYKQLNTQWKLIIAPHEVNAQRIKEVISTFNQYSPATLSGATEKELSNARILIIDSIGILNRIYRYAAISYVGGAFGTGLHNILEAAVWGKPIIHGPNYEKFQEALDLEKLGGSSPVLSESEAAEEIIKLAHDSETRKKMGEISKEYVYRNEGASEKIISFLEKKRIF